MQFENLTSISNVTVQHICSDNAAGTGTITAASVDTLTWTAPGSSTAGAAVTIANGEAQILADGDDTTQYIVVERTSTTDLSGSAQILVYGTATTSERLAEVDAAITECLKAQSAGSQGDNVTRASLATLYEMRKELQKELRREQNTAASHGRADMRSNF